MKTMKCANLHGINDLRYEDIPTKFASRMAKSKLPLLPPEFRCVDNLVLNDTVFSVL